MCWQFVFLCERITVKVLFVLIFTMLTTCVIAQESKQKILKHTNVGRLKAKANVSDKHSMKQKHAAVLKAKEKGWIIKKEFENGKVMEIQDVKNGKPVYYITYNIDAAKTISTNEVWSGGGSGLDLSGKDMTVGIWDSKGVLTTHEEFNGRVHQQDNSFAVGGHSTHVTATIGARGFKQEAKGMAHKSNLDAYDWNSDLSEMALAASNGLMVSNHSYGVAYGYYWTGSGWKWNGDTNVSSEEDYHFGFYNQDCADWDQIARDAPYYQIVVAAGNDRAEGPVDGDHEKDGGANGYDCIGGHAVAKNVITVGAVKDMIDGYHGNPGDVKMLDGSSWGPADDGRIKPDITANGYQLYSAEATGDTAYAKKSGTSMAAPGVSGSLILLQEHHNNLFNEFMKASTLKALMIHTADEAGFFDGPDYKFGWGLMNTQKAAKVISQMKVNSFIKENTLNEGSSYSYEVYSKGENPLRVTLGWTDPPGNPVSPQLDPRDPMLVNDLDVRVKGPSGTIYKPYKLDPENPSNAATTGDNDVDNVEKIEINSPQSGIYKVIVSHEGTLKGGKQNYSLIISEILANRPNDFKIGSVNNTSVKLSWRRNVNNDEVMLAFSHSQISDEPAQGQTYSVGDSIGEAEILYLGTDTTFLHENLQSGNEYYYTAWSVDESNNYSPGVSDSTITAYDVIFTDDFETDEGWNLTGEFERAEPKGLGGSNGNPDPVKAYQGENILGTDLTGLGGAEDNPEGDYEGDLNDRAYKAISPLIDCRHYSEVQLEFQKWLNVESPAKDSVQIDISLDSGATWQNLWYNDKEYTDSTWDDFIIDISDFADDTSGLKIRYTVGETDSAGYNYSGWNIDDFRITGRIPRYEVILHITDGTSPIEDAYVELDDFTGFTDTSGYILFPGIRKGTRSYVVRKPGFDNVSDTLDITGKDTVEVSMNSGTATFEVGLTVINGDTAVQNTSVQLNNDTLVTDKNGHVVFRGIEAGTYPFYYQDGTREDSGIVSIVDRNIDTTVYFHYNLLFNIFDTLSNPIENAIVSLEGKGDSLTNAAGQVMFKNLIAKSEMSYSVSASNFEKKSGTVALINKDTSENVYLKPGNKVKFYIRSDTDKPVENAKIVIKDDTLSTDSSGYTAITLSDGTYQYQVAANGFYTSGGNFEVNGATLNEKVFLTKIYNILFVVDDGQQPLAEAKLNFTGKSYLTDNFGQVSIDTSSGTYAFSLIKDGYYSLTDSVTVDHSNVNRDISLPRINSVTFVVSDSSTGAEVEGAEIEVGDRILQTDSTGITTLDTSNGTYKYLVSKDKYESYIDSVKILNADTSLNIELSEENTNIDDLAGKNSILVYPNPAKGKIYIESEDGLEGAMVQVLNASGIRLVRKEAHKENKIILDMSDFPEGVYIIIVQKEEIEYSGKVILRK